MRQRVHFFVFLLLIIFCCATDAETTLSTWPESYSDGQNQLFVYQPQIESWKDRLTVSGKMAIQLLLKGETKPLVGAVWFTAETAVNDDLTMVFLNHFNVSKVIFYDTKSNLSKRAASVSKDILSDKAVILSLDQLLTMALTAKETPKKALIKTQIPHLATVKRDQVKFSVQYTGKPQFKPILGTSLDYAVNTPSTIIKVGGRYFALLNGVWFVAEKAEGPFKVAVNIPSEIERIPPTSIVHHASYVKIYSVNPSENEVVFGYTAPYLKKMNGLNPYAAWGAGITTQWNAWSKESVSQINNTSLIMPPDGQLYVGKDKKVYRLFHNQLERYENGQWILQNNRNT